VLVISCFRATVKSLTIITHASFIVLLVLLSTISLSILGIFTSLYNFYENLLLTNGEGLVISSYAISPLTSVVSEEYVRNLVNDLEGISVESLVFSIAYFKGKTVVIRGIEKTEFSSFHHYHGSGSNISCVVVGEGLARELNLSEGETLALYSPFIKEPVLVTVCGVKQFHSLLNYEIIASIELSRTIRGISNNQYSVVILRAKNLSILSSISARIGLNPEDIKLLQKALLVLSQRGNILVHELHGDIPEIYVAKLGIHRDFIFSLSYTVAALVIISDILIGEHIFRSAKKAIAVLRYLGISRKRVFALLTLQTLTYVAVAVLVAFTILQYFNDLIKLEVLSHRMSPQMSLYDTLFVFSSKTSLLLVGVSWGFVRSEE